MKFVEGRPAALPGSCYLCNNASRDKYVDLETQVEFHGAMYFCDLCITELASLLNMLPSQEGQRLQLENLGLRTQVDSLKGEITGLKKVIDGYSDIRSNYAFGSGASDVDDSSEQRSSEGKRTVERGKERSTR